MMILSIGIYAFKTVSNGGIDFSLLILNEIYGNTMVGSSEGEQNQMYNYLSQSNDNSKIIDSAHNSITTETGYEGLSTASEFSAYKLIKSQCNRISNEVYKYNLYAINTVTVPNCNLSVPQIKKILYAIQNDNPNIFWLSSTFSYRYSGNRTLIQLNSIFSKNEQEKALEKLNNKVSEIISTIPKDSTEYEAELLIHDYIVNNCRYKKISVNSQSNPKIFTSYGCLVEGSAVCEGYSKSMQLLMNRIGIKCGTVTGARESEPHMWNIVKINDNWYHIDVTWDGSGDLARYNYFNVTDEVIKKDHKINEELSKTTIFSEDKRYNFKLPACTATAENYFEKNAVKISSLSDQNSDKAIINKLTALASAKKPYLYILVDKNLSLETIKNQLLTVRPYKLFSCMAIANKPMPNGNKINTRQVNYTENKNQNVLIIKLNYE